MLKKIIVAVIILISVLVIAGYFFFRGNENPQIDFFETIPDSVAVILYSNSFYDLAHEFHPNNKMWEEITSIKEVNQLNSFIAIARKKSKSSEAIKDLLDRPFLLSLLPSDGKEINHLLVAQFKHSREQQVFEKVLLPVFSKSNKHIKEGNIHKWIDYKDNSFYLAFHEGIVLISDTVSIINKAILQLKSGKSIKDDPMFMSVHKTIGQNVQGNIYLNYNELPEILSKVTNDKSRNVIESLKGAGSWVALDINLKEDALLLNGFTSYNDTLKDGLIELLKNQVPVDHEIYKIFPSSTAGFILLGISSVDNLYKTAKIHNEEVPKILQQYTSIGITVEDLLDNLIDNELGVVFTHDKKEERTSYIVVKTRSRTITQDFLEEILSRLASAEGKTLRHFTSTIRIDSETSFQVFSYPFQKLFSLITNNIIDDSEKKYFTFVGNQMVIANNKEDLKSFIHAFVLKENLGNDLRFLQFSDYLSSKSNFYLYSEAFKDKELLYPNVSENSRNFIEENYLTLSKFQAFAIQLRSSEGRVYNNIFLKYIPEVKRDAETVWESHLDTVSNMKPAFVRNHYTGENEIFVQDVNNRIYLINKVGRILWRYQLKEPVMGDVHQVDYYKNGKLQLLFNTRNALHLIDRNGNYVERYPIRFNSSATAEMALFDYDNNLEYRIFIPFENKRIGCFAIDGSEVEGWNFKTADTKVTTKIQHFRNGTRDYIVFADKYKTYILNRRGHTRVEVKQNFSKSINNIIYLEPSRSNSKARLVTTDTSGYVKHIYFNGSVETNPLRRFSTKHHFDFADVNADGEKDYIFLDRNELVVLKQNGEKIFSHEFENNIALKPIYFYFSEKDRKIGITDEINNRIYLFNSDGKLYEGFPMEGNTRFTIGYLGNKRNHFNLIVGSGYNFIFNYSVN